MYCRRHVATFCRKTRHLSLAVTGKAISAVSKTGIIFLTFTA